MGAKNSKAAKQNSSSSKHTSTAKRGRKKSKQRNGTSTVSFKDSKKGESSQDVDTSNTMARRRSSSAGFLRLLTKTESFKIRKCFTC